MKKLLAILLAAVMVIPMFAACKPKDSGKPGEPTQEPGEVQKTEEPGEPTDEPATNEPEVHVPATEIPVIEDYEELSSAIYEAQLGEFKAYYDKAQDASTISERFALMAIAEAKLMESGCVLPGTTRGGNYGMTRVARRSGTTVLWGSDTDRWSSLIIATEPILKEHNTELIRMWNELKGSGTYAEEAVKYLTDNGYTLKDEYRTAYNSDPKTWDALNTSRQPDTECILETLNNLVEYDCENVMKPALAESWEVSDDGLVYTFHLRPGLKWVDHQGREVADVQADDFVAGMQHMCDAQGGLEYLVDGIIENATEYMSGDVTDFAEVGVKAVDATTLQYTLVKPVSYFMTMLTYSCFSPMCRSFFESRGGAFGLEEYQTAAAGDNYTYGTSFENIAYCGPYLVTNHTPESIMVYEANPTFWNKDNIRIHKVTRAFIDMKNDPMKIYNDFKTGDVDGCGLTADRLEAAKADGLFDKYALVSDTDATSFVMFININRSKYCNFDDETKCVSQMTDEQKEATKIAMYNAHFRRAIGMGLDMASYNAQVVGDELALVSVRNSYTPGNFVSLEEETTVEINGEAKTYPAGTFYGKIMQDQITADGVKIKVWDDETKSSDGFAGWYNPDNAMEELQIAIEELKDFGLDISPENPIYMDLPAFTAYPVYANRANALKQSIEASLQGYVIVNLVDCASDAEWYNCGFYTETGSDANYHLYDVSGWGPDYGDPATYLDTMLPDHAGYMTKCLGIF